MPCPSRYSFSATINFGVHSETLGKGRVAGGGGGGAPQLLSKRAGWLAAVYKVAKQLTCIGYDLVAKGTKKLEGLEDWGLGIMVSTSRGLWLDNPGQRLQQDLQEMFKL